MSEWIPSIKTIKKKKKKVMHFISICFSLGLGWCGGGYRNICGPISICGFHRAIFGVWTSYDSEREDKDLERNMGIHENIHNHNVDHFANLPYFYNLSCLAG